LVFLQNKERPFGFAGLYDRWKNPESGELTTSFAIITTTANEILQSIGIKRMPVILTKSNEKDWIKSTRHLSEVLGMLNQFPSEQMNAYPISDLVDNPEINEISMINPIGDKLQSAVEPPTRIIRSIGRIKKKLLQIYRGLGINTINPK
jgi:putative SOS response-associated peptidase YedK